MTLVAVLAWISGILNIIGGILVLTGVIAVPGEESAAAGWVAIIFGTIVFLVSMGLFRGSSGARSLTALAFVLNIAAGAFVLLTHSLVNVSVIVSLFFAVIGLILLFTGRANEFFRAN
ncbi:hypothetical protein [Microbacterium hominis]|uniref:Uncharacterized protein n=1 Tax=Microbacterium hominis TaxID=162426 RepID=A0A7D4UA63_9MICO|nr:hypothetical protein [Microbacterium hominis]QKJ18083.1 hypothetical protein HQM25_00745 [Microbacterium hominis]